MILAVAHVSHSGLSFSAYFLNSGSGAEFQDKQRSQGRDLTEHVPEWKKTAEVKKSNYKKFGCWNCDAKDHGAVKCPYTLSP